MRKNDNKYFKDFMKSIKNISEVNSKMSSVVVITLITQM